MSANTRCVMMGHRAVCSSTICAATGFILTALLGGVLTGLELGRVLGPCAAQGVRGWLSGCRSDIVPPSNRYWDGRKHNTLYSRHGIVQTLARAHAANALTMLDVGSFVPNIVASFDWIPTKVGHIGRTQPSPLTQTPANPNGSHAPRWRRTSKPTDRRAGTRCAVSPSFGATSLS